MRILCIGDIVGQPGRKSLALSLKGLIVRHEADFIIANAENAAGGFGLTPKICTELFSLGIDVITTGNHVWRNKEILKILDKEPRLLRPLNFPEGVPGKGCGVFEKNGHTVGVVNLMGRVFMEPIDCPFKAAKQAADAFRGQGVSITVMDFHAEATSEKAAMGHYVDGEYSLIFGTHTHVQTADARILGGGTAYITDIGMTGPTDSVIGVMKERAIKKFVTGMPSRFDLAEGGVEINGCVCGVDTGNGRAQAIEAFSEKVVPNASK